MYAAVPKAYSAAERGIVGQSAPELDVKMWLSADGKPGGAFTVEDNTERYVVLKFWQSWCPGCHSNGLPALRKISQALKDDDRFAFAALQTTFEGFNTNTEDKVAEIQSKYELAMPVGHAAPGENGERIPPVMVKYRTGGTPWFIIIEPGGKVVFNDFNIDADRFLEWTETLA